MEPESLVRGAVDLYNHANPDLLPRHFNDIGMARVAQSAGVSAVVHRHHYVATDDRAAMASDETGFCVLGAIELGDAVGMNPWAVELALAGGACWVSLPTLSAAAFRPGLARMTTSPYQKALTFGPGELRCLDGTGQLVPAVRAVLDLVHDAGAVLRLGYVSFDEAVTAARSAAELGIERMVVTNPRPRFSDSEIRALAGVPGVYFEVTCYMAHPEGPAGPTSATAVDNIVDAIRTVGVERSVISSDGGMVDAPLPPVILAWGLAELSRRGFMIEELRTLVHKNPRRLVPAPPSPD
jgi:Family of unknown function (DUF6282)